MEEKSNNKGVFYFYKRVGETPLEAINRFRKENVENNPELDFLPITYAGRLDPMAEGILIFLVGDEAKKKEKYLGLNKTYEFEVLWGFETDSLDLLGEISNLKSQISKEKVPEKEQIEECLKKSVGKFEQMYPAFSSRPVGGKPLFEWAREGKIDQVMIPKHEVEVFSAGYLERKIISKDELLGEIERKVSLVNGDFRQEETIRKWKEVLGGATAEEFVVDKVKVSVSSGFYVRQFVSDMARSFDTIATTYSINRTQVGDGDL